MFSVISVICIILFICKLALYFIPAKYVMYFFVCITLFIIICLSALVAPILVAPILVAPILVVPILVVGLEILCVL